MADEMGQLPRLFRKILGEVRRMTTPEVILSGILAVAALVFKYFLGGGLSLKDVLSIVIPFLWAACALGCFFTAKAAISLHREDIIAWNEWKSPLYGNFPKPKRPSVSSGTTIAAIVLSAFLIGVFYLTLKIPQGAPIAVSKQDQKLPTSSERSAEGGGEIAVRPTVPPSSHPRTTVTLIFKDSPLFTPGRKQRIKDQMSVFRSYLVNIGFDAPLELPPLGTRPGRIITSGGSDPRIYYQGIDIGEDVIDDPMTIRAAYADYAFPKMLDVIDLNRRDNAYRQIASHVFGTYFNWSFADKRWNQPPRIDSWEGALWEIRQRCGRSFTDLALFYMFKTIGDFIDPTLLKDPQASYTVSTEEFNSYFYHGFMIGEHVVDNQLHNLAKINQILKSRGLVAK